MRLAITRSLLITAVTLAFWLATPAQDVTRELKVTSGSTIEIVNRFGRVGVKAETVADEKTLSGKLVASSPKGVSDGEIKIGNAGGKTTITVVSNDPRKRIDLVLTLPERSNVIVQTLAGAVEVNGNFASVAATTDTGTVAVDVPNEDVTYNLLWTESKPRVVADFDLAAIKEKNAGRFEIRGRSGLEGKSKKAKGKSAEPGSADEQPMANDEQPRPVRLDLTTARGIILINVPPNEVMSDLRERPLTNAAKAIVRSGDSLLMEAIRRAAPKYYGDYARSLPPMMFEPKFSAKSAQTENPNASLKTALVRVTDLKNRSIAGLTTSDFEITESGTAREIVSVERSTAPFNLVLLLDVSGSVENYVNFIRKAARAFVNTVDEKDRVSIVIFNDDVKVLSKFTTDKGKLSESLDTFDAGGGTAYYDALAYAVSDTLRQFKGERTAIVILTDGDDNRSFLAFDALAGSIQESGALIYPLYVPSGLIAAAAANPNADIDPVRRKYMSVSAKAEGEGERLARVSGGVYYPIKEIAEIQKAYEDIVVQLRSAYNITFKSETSSGNSPRLKIKSKRENTFATVTSVVASQ
ncbi:MAG: VWA domain-containing protein [Chloracidobacterium sp.]|nr:VWA domain-containing protein [Chloracidobacterium sp.]